MWLLMILLCVVAVSLYFVPQYFIQATVSNKIIVKKKSDLLVLLLVVLVFDFTECTQDPITVLGLAQPVLVLGFVLHSRSWSCIKNVTLCFSWFCTPDLEVESEVLMGLCPSLVWWLHLHI